MMAQLPTMQDLRESHQALQEALRSSAKPSVEGLAYLRELRASVASQGQRIEAEARRRGGVV
jgi:hypothetical protein